MKCYPYLLLLATLFGSSLQAQSPKLSSFWEAGVLVGASAYGGDLRSEDLIFLDQPGFGIGAGLRYHLGAAFALRAGGLRGTLRADDAKDIPQRRERGFSFKTQLTELTLQGEWHPLGYRRYRNGVFHPIWSPYVFGGVGIAIADPETDFNNRESAGIRADRATEEKANLVLPLGLGLRIDLSERVALGIEYGYRASRTDYLDGVSQAGNPGQNDHYAIGTVQLWKRFGTNDRDRDGVADAVDGCPDAAGPSATGGCPDTDRDGIADRDDQCPTLAGTPTLAGCPDADNDGITDALDHCPTLAGTRATNGCPDQDNDTVPDSEDDCPTISGLVALRGCPDSDNDGVSDADDRCPDRPGSRSLLGCPDTDGDGIGDSEDKCPTRRGLNMLQGCPDTDGDGIGDDEDQCPTQVGLRANGGCPEIQAADQRVLEFAARNIQFETGSARIRGGSFAILDQIAAILARYPDFRVDIGGHTDNVGNDQLNLNLSRDRARAAYDYLVAQGISPDRMAYRGYGEAEPVATNATAAGRRQNRRVVFELTPR